MRYLVLFCVLFLTAFAPAARADVDHSIFDALLKKYVNERGMVNYKGFKKDEKELRRYLDLLSKNPPKAGWSADEKLAYWINAYNAFTIQLILDHYPVKSIKDIGTLIQIPYVNTPWDIEFIRIGGKKYDLNNIEHDIIRKEFNDPRIHFALVCAAKSCPKLRNEAFVAARLNRQLDEQGRDFLNNPAKNAITARQASLSKILDWYAGDFKKNGQTVVSWVNRYSNVKINSETDLSYQTYDWSLNEP
ncbi:DUF547 domain-containing protein [Tellurirhabdus rosea]|uniref:DUF547 domain-containing protein n=1 Tax=Tellurirhabdus rosea TaxID=2674997 RepID=UPI00225B5F37|nr:DUF547 domain-containing protein [Tellurirhabdus rosea]